MSSSDRDFVSGAVAGALLVGFISVAGTVILGTVTDAKWKRQAVEHGAAEYDQQTGHWRWKVKVENE